MKADLILHLGVLLCGIGMMLVIAGVITGGLFRVGAAVILIGMLVCGAAGVLHIVRGEGGASSTT